MYVISLFILAALLLIAAILAYMTASAKRAARRAFTQPQFRASLRNNWMEVQGREYLADLLQINPSALPPMGSWSATAAFLIILAETILCEKPQQVVEFGAGISTQVALRCLELNGSGHLTSYEAEAEFAAVAEARVRRMGLASDMRVVPLRPMQDYPGVWYQAKDLPERIDLIVVDGPPARIHPETRQGAATAFSRLSPNGTVLLDDAGRAGERAIVENWRKAFPDINFAFISTVKGTVIGKKAA